MRITNLHISNYKILQNFKIDKNQEAVSVFIGINGSGKSSLLEATALIFSQTYQYHIEGNKSIIPFSDFSITYHIWPTTVIEDGTILQETRTDYLIVTIVCNKEKKLKFDIKVQGEIPKPVKGEDIKSTIRKVLPANVIIYYAGLNETMQKLCNIHEIAFSKQLQDNKVEGLRPLFYYKPQHYNLLLLALLSFEFGDIPEYVKQYLNIEAVKNFSINIKKPSWGKGKADNFWGAAGAVATFLKFCAEECKNLTISDDDNLVSMYFEGLQPLFAMRDHYGEEKKLFQILDILLFDDLLENINIVLIKEGVEVRGEDLSEGEQQFLTIKALNELLITPFTLLLFDEPDTFLHPQLQVKFISELVEYSNNACYYITTHSSILISNLERGNLYAMSRGKIKQVEEHYYGREYSHNLEDIMHTSGRNKESQDDLNLIFDLIDNKKLDEAKAKIMEFETKYGPDDPEVLRANSLMDFME